MPETSYTTLLIHAVETLEQNFSRYIVEIRLQGQTDIIAELTGGAVRQKNLSWLMTPLEWGGAIIGTIYEHRIFVEDFKGNRSAVTDWVSETAGDTTLPDNPSSFKLDSTKGSATCFFGYTEPSDFDKFEWIVKYNDQSNPVATDVPSYITLDSALTVAGSSGDLVSFWVRAKDQSGNINDGGYRDCGDVDIIPPSTAANLLGNGGFELGLSGWDRTNINFAIATGSSDARSGNKYVKIEGTGSTQLIPYLEYFSVIAGETYILEGWTRKDSGGSISSGIQIQWYDADKVATSLIAHSILADSTYDLLHKSGVVPSGSVWGRVVIKAFASLTSGNHMRLDDITLRRLSPIEGLADNDDIVIRIGGIYLWHDGTNLRHDDTAPATGDSALSGEIASASPLI